MMKFNIYINFHLDRYIVNLHVHVISPKRISPHYIQIVREIKINFKRLKFSKNVYCDIIWTYLNVTPRDKLITWDPFWFCLFTPEIGSPCTWLTCLLSNALTLLSCKLKNFFQTPLKCIVSGNNNLLSTRVYM